MEDNATDTVDYQKDKEAGPRANEAWNMTGGKYDKKEAVLLLAYCEKM